MGNAKVLDHQIFTPEGWARATSFTHPRLRLKISTNRDDYDRIHVRHPHIKPCAIGVVADTGAQSCLWSRQEFLKCGFSLADLIPVRQGMRAANQSPMQIDGAILLRLQGESVHGDSYQAAVMVYVSPEANAFYLSMEAMIQLGVVHKQFPQIGSASEESSPSCGAAMVSPLGKSSPDVSSARCGEAGKTGGKNEFAECGCLQRSKPPGRPDKLPFKPIPENTDVMRNWLLEMYGPSTFNKCKHQGLPEMEGPPLKLHVKDNAVPYKCTKAPPVPLHWEQEVYEDLMSDVKMGVIERHPHGEKVTHCTRMVVRGKPDGRPRRTVDLSHLNSQCDREDHPMRSPFHLARAIPPNSIKTVFDAWNGYHSRVLEESSRQYTTFTTPWGLFRYKRAPQGSKVSGDAYNRRFDEITSEAGIVRLQRIVDDCCLHDPVADMESHWWRVIDFLETCGHAGIVLNSEKFQFAQGTVDFAGFRISEQAVEPLPKYLDAIRSYPTPENTTDIRSWFGLVNQVSHYSQLTTMMEPFRRFLSPNEPFEWNEEYDRLFNQSKLRIIEAIQQGVKIFDPNKPTALIPDWSKSGVGFWLVQKHCACTELAPPDCCENGWRIVLAGSRFLSTAERNYAPVEGEALAVAWSLEQTRFFTLGCSDLIVVSDHKPLLKLLGDRRLDEVENPRLFRLKQRTLLWSFQMRYRPGKQNHTADALSRRPNKFAELASLSLQSTGDKQEELLAAVIAANMQDFFAVTWDMCKTESANDPVTSELIKTIVDGFPDSREKLSHSLQPYWEYRHSLSVTDGVATYMDRAIIPQSLRQQVLSNIHSAHQGVSGMHSRAANTVFWPGYTTELDETRRSCRTCDTNAPSQPKLPPVEPNLPKVPFQMIAADYFDLRGHHYLVVVDRLSGWLEVLQIKPSTTTAGAKGLCTALRRIFATFGVPEEISSDGGPEFVAKLTLAFYQRWGTSHRLSSSHNPQSNGRAEQAVKVGKRLIEDNVNTNGDLDTDRLVAALLQHRNTPDRECKLSPAEILFGRPLRDSLPCLDKSKTIFENENVRPCWRNNWSAKEDALRTRIALNCEQLENACRELPPLEEGDSVLIQNQTPTNRPNKWDREGVVVSTGKHDQYLVRVVGSGRLTLRNRRFLRKFQSGGVTNTLVNAGTPGRINTPQPAVIPASPTPMTSVPENTSGDSHTHEFQPAGTPIPPRRDSFPPPVPAPSPESPRASSSIEPRRPGRPRTVREPVAPNPLPEEVTDPVMDMPLTRPITRGYQAGATRPAVAGDSPAETLPTRKDTRSTRTGYFLRDIANGH